MNIETYITYSKMLIKEFGEDHYPVSYINKCWPLWKDAEDFDFIYLVKKILETKIEKCLAIEASKLKKVYFDGYPSYLEQVSKMKTKGEE